MMIPLLLLQGTHQSYLYWHYQCRLGWKIHHMGVKTTFLNGMIEEEVYIEQP